MALKLVFKYSHLKIKAAKQVHGEGAGGDPSSQKLGSYSTRRLGKKKKNKNLRSTAKLSELLSSWLNNLANNIPSLQIRRKILVRLVSSPPPEETNVPDPSCFPHLSHTPTSRWKLGRMGEGKLAFSWRKKHLSKLHIITIFFKLVLYCAL